MKAKGYEKLGEVLEEAFSQAAHGKGKERHAIDLPFHEQPMQQLCDQFGVGFALGQAAKKMQESQRLPYGRDRAELLGAIVYCAGAIIALDRQASARTVAEAVNDNGFKCVRAGGCLSNRCADAGACQA